MNKYSILLITAVVLITGLVLYLRQDQQTRPVTTELVLPLAVDTPESAGSEPVQFPVPEPPAQAAQQKPLPTLDESDKPVEEEFAGLVDDSGLAEIVLFNAFIRNSVVTVDNLTGTKLPQKYLFLRPPPGKFLVREEDNEQLWLDPENFKRYRVFVRLIEAVDTERLAGIYIFLYPLFQQAYEELGYPDRYFNDRLLEAISHLLQTPEPTAPIALTRPRVYFQFADPALEALSAGQKILLRIGPDNAEKVKAKLEELQMKLANLRPQAGP